MKVSIVTISYNQAQFLEQALSSVLDQDYSDIEYIVVDAGSTDGSREIIQRYADRLSKIVFEPDEGPADGLNKGFKYATGDIFYYLNADDVLLPRALSKVVAAFHANSSIDVIYGHGYVINGDSRVIRDHYSTPFSLRDYIYDNVSIMQQSTFFRRSTFEAAGGFNPKNKTCWDGELVLDFGLLRFKFKLLPEFLAMFRIYGGSISGSGRLSEQYRLDCERLFQKAMGRPRSWYDRALVSIARAKKLALNPKYTWSRLSAKDRRNP